jgi:hypothetical protein
MAECPAVHNLSPMPDQDHGARGFPGMNGFLNDPIDGRQSLFHQPRDPASGILGGRHGWFNQKT